MRSSSKNFLTAKILLRFIQASGGKKEANSLVRYKAVLNVAYRGLQIMKLG